MIDESYSLSAANGPSYLAVDYAGAQRQAVLFLKSERREITHALRVEDSVEVVDLQKRPFLARPAARSGGGRYHVLERPGLLEPFGPFAPHFTSILPAVPSITLGAADGAFFAVDFLGMV